MAKKLFFSLDIVHYVSGVADTVFSNNKNCAAKRLPVAMPNGDTAFYIYEPCKHLQFTKDIDNFKITLAGKEMNDSTFKRIVNYPFASSQVQLNSKPTYVLQNAYGDNELVLRKNEAKAVALYF